MVDLQEQKFMIKTTRLATMERRRSQQVCSCEFKIDKSKLSRHQQWFLNQVFVEAKWYYNHIIGFLKQGHTINEFKKSIYIKEVNGLDKDKNPILRKLSLPSRIKNGIYQNVMSSLRTLSTKHKRKQGVGDLKFKKEINTILLNNMAFMIDANKIKIIGLSKFPIIINGVDQIPDNAEFASANLIKKSNNYFIHLMYYVPKQQYKLNNKIIGLDFGIKDDVVSVETNLDNIKDCDSLVNANFEINKYNISVKPSFQIKRRHRQLSRTVKGSKRNWKAKTRLNKAYDKYTRQKKYQADTLFSHIKPYQVIVVQDDYIQGWIPWWGKKILEATRGYLLAKIKRLPQTIVVSRWFPSSQLCVRCGCLNKFDLSQRRYVCDCGVSEDRDSHSAKVILAEGLSNNFNIPMINRELTPVETESSTMTVTRREWRDLSENREALLVNN
jgi:putative transposase